LFGLAGLDCFLEKDVEGVGEGGVFEELDGEGTTYGYFVVRGANR
jgi:hypothetical protein